MVYIKTLDNLGQKEYRNKGKSDKDFFKRAKQQGYYYYCSSVKCRAKFLSINDADNHGSCLGLMGSGRNQYFPIQVYFFPDGPEE